MPASLLPSCSQRPTSLTSTSEDREQRRSAEPCSDRALAAEKAALGGSRRDQLQRRLGRSSSARTIALATSTGFSGAYRSTGHSCSAGVIAGEGAAMQRDSAWHGARHLEDLDAAEEIGRLAGERAVARLNPSRPKAGRYPVLFDPRVAGSLLGHFAGAITGSRGRSQVELPPGQARRARLRRRA